MVFTNITRFFRVLCTHLFVFLFLLHSIQAKAVILKVGLYDNKPKIFRDDQGKPSGIFADILADIAGNENLQLEYVYGTWQQCLSRLENGEIDIMHDVSFTEERAKIYDFGSVPVLSDWFQIYARTGDNISSILELTGSRVGVLSQSVQHHSLTTMTRDYGISAEIICTDDYPQLVTLLKTGKIDYAVFNRYYIPSKETAARIKTTPIIFNPTRLHFAFAKNRHADLIRRIDKQLEAMMENPDSVYYQSLHKWTDRAQKPMVSHKFRSLFIGALGFLAALAIYSYFLIRIVRKKSAELLYKNEALAQAQSAVQNRERLFSLGQMAGGIAHDFNNVLSAIIGYAEYIIDYNEKKIKDPGIRDGIESIRNAAGDAAAIVTRMHEFYRKQNDKESPQLVCLKTLAEEIVTLVRPRFTLDSYARGKKLELLCITEASPLVAGYESQLKETLMNLIFNAVDACSDGGTVTMRVCRDGENALIEVSDTGKGMDKETAEHAFEPFFTTKGEQGTGLGLSMVKEFVEKHNGKLVMKTACGKGTTISISLPIAKSRGELPQQVTGNACRNLNIAIVDDDLRVLQSLSLMLLSDGHKARTYLSAEDSLQEIRENRPDLLLTDDDLPGMSGTELASEVRKIHPGLKMILMSGFDPSLKKNQDRHMVDLCLSKPLSLATLHKAFTDLGLSGK
ncbi:MAG: transporter substrate-binding domain-containing protein [Candidatus Wallbacteria bacterium]|nr:transporter substrate-binding domain-containing protein [Candidatus Wallbacteria bacterium]